MQHYNPTRRLAAILAIDVAGYSRMMAVDEAGTHRKFRAHRLELIEPLIWEHQGRIVKGTGDGLLAEFPTAVDAVYCAVALQRGMAARNLRETENPILFRAAINVGDIIVEQDDIYGDGVNVAVRLEALAQPGGLCMSQQAHDQVRARLPIKLDDLGEQTLKNIPRPVRVFALSARKIAAFSDSAFPAPPGTAQHFDIYGLARRRSSVAVLPFANLSRDQEQDYFADGVVEEIITGLSLFRSLFVIARNSSFTYKGRAVDPRRVAAELGVRHVVEGSIQRAKNRVRIKAQLVDAESGGYLWADQFDGDDSDIFALQDNVAQRVVTAIEPKILALEVGRAKRKPAESLDAYDCYLRALPLRFALTATTNEEALALLRRAIELDPNYAPALAHASACYLASRDQGWRDLTPEDIAEGLRLARRAVEADPDDPIALCLGGHTLAGLTDDFEAGLAWIDRAVRLNPNYAEGWMRSAMVRVYVSDLEKAIEHAERAMVLSPVDPKLYHPLCAQGYAYLFQGRYEEAAKVSRRALLGKQKPEMAYRILVAALGGLGRDEEMLAAARAFMEQKPKFRISAWRKRSAFTSDPRFDTMEKLLRKAGLPD